MRKPLIVVGSIVGALILALIAIFIYAAANLNSIIAENRGFLLQRVSAALGRRIEVAQIRAHLGWGVSADLTGVTVADDPDFSARPFVSTSDVSAKLELIPLLARQLRVSKVVLNGPEIRIIRNGQGELNVSTIGKKSAVGNLGRGQEEKSAGGGAISQSPLNEAPKKTPGGAGAIGVLEVHNFAIQEGKIVYVQAGLPPVTISHIDLDLKGFTFTSPVDLALVMAVFGDEQNIKLAGRLGPLATGGRIDPNEIGIDLHLQAGPVAVAQVGELEFAKAITAKLEVSDKVSLDASMQGKLDALSIKAASDLTPNRVAFGDSFQKPAGTTLKFAVDASRNGSEVGVSKATIVLGDLNLEATAIKFGGGSFSGKIDTNRFDIASLAKLVPTAAKFGITGKGEVHSQVAYAGGKASANGVVTLAGVTSPRPGQGGTAVSDLGGDIKLSGTAADIGPLAFKLGTGRATLSARSDPIYPPRATYEFTADALRTTDFSPHRPANEELTGVRATGTFSMANGVTVDDNKLTSPAGNLNNIAYTGLTVVTSLAGKQLHVSQLEIGAFGGSISGTADASLETGGPFNAAVTMAGLDLQQALQSQKAKAAGVVRGFLSGRVQLSGKNQGSFDAIKPTLTGSGQAQVARGKLVGINLGAQVFAKTQNLPVIGSLVPQSIANNHPELFSNPDTDFEQLGLTFAIQGPRITTHDLAMRTADYAMNGDGWFDMDKNIDLTARILLTQQLTNEIIAQKKNVVYVTNNSGQIDIPLRITGQLPKPTVVPDVGDLAQRAGQRAVEEQGQKALGKLMGKKGLGAFLGGGGNANTKGGNGGNSQPANPLDQLKGLFGR
jgi:hypothetical protein